jgi:hypothetical protein
VAWTTYFSCARTASTRARARMCESMREHMINRSPMYGQILFKLAVNILQITTSSIVYVLFMSMHRAHKHVLIFRRFLFKFAVNILRITTNSMGCALFMFTHRIHACSSAFAYLWTDSLQICGEHTTNHNK